MKKLTGILLAMAVAVFITSFPREVRGKDAYRILMVLGDVKIIAGGRTHAATVNENLSGGETISTGVNSMADLSMGGKGILRLQEKTKIAVASLAGSKKESNLNMESGRVIVLMSKLKKGNSYEVRTSTNVASVRGTVFQVSGDESQSQLDVLTGSVAVNPLADGAVQRHIEEIVSENQSLSLDKAVISDILSKKKKMSLSEMRKEVRESFMKQIQMIRETPEFKAQSEDLKKEINERILKMKKEYKDKKPERDALKEKLKEEKERLKRERGQRK